MPITGPKFVLLDTATINLAALKPRDVGVQELLIILNSGEWIPFITQDHLQEVASHKNDATFRQRIDFLKKLKHVSYLNRHNTQSVAGSFLDLRDLEIKHLLKNPYTPWNEIVSALHSQVVSGYLAGVDFVNNNICWLESYRTHFLEETLRQTSEMANLTHFPTIDTQKPLPKKGAGAKVCSEMEAIRRLADLASKLEFQINQDGDIRHIDPRQSAFSLMREVFQETRADLESEDFLESVLIRSGIDRSRLPQTPTIDDAGYEAIFNANLNVHERRLLVSKTELLKHIRKENIPSWSIWQDLDRRTKSLQKAENGNFTDTSTACFGLYLDLINVDKRIAELIRQGSRHCPMLSEINRRTPKRRGLKGLVEALKGK